MVNTKGDNQKTLQSLEILFGSVTRQSNTKQFLIFLERYFEYLNQLPEFAELITKYNKEETDSQESMSEFNQKLSDQIDLEVKRIFSKDIIDLDRITSTMNTDWGEQEDDVPRDGSNLLKYHSELNRKGGITRYLKLKDLIDYVDARHDDIFSFICGLDNLAISPGCLLAFESWLKKYKEINPNGQIWWAFKEITIEKGKEFKKINFTKLKEYLNAFHEDMKQYLIFGLTQQGIKSKKLPIPSGVHFEDPEGSKYYILKGLNGKCLRFKNKDEDICKLFQFYYENHGLPMSNEDAYKSVKNPERAFVNMMTSLKGTIRRQQLKNIVQLEGSRLGSYRLEIKINS